METTKFQGIVKESTDAYTYVELYVRDGEGRSRVAGKVRCNVVDGLRPRYGEAVNVQVTDMGKREPSSVVTGYVNPEDHEEFIVGDVVHHSDLYALPEETVLRSVNPRPDHLPNSVFQTDSWGDAQMVGIENYVHDIDDHLPATIIWLPEQDGTV